jgi:hypothetical protein
MGGAASSTIQGLTKYFAQLSFSSAEVLYLQEDLVT